MQAFGAAEACEPKSTGCMGDDVHRDDRPMKWGRQWTVRQPRRKCNRNRKPGVERRVRSVRALTMQWYAHQHNGSIPSSFFCSEGEPQKTKKERRKGRKRALNMQTTETDALVSMKNK